LRVQGSGLRVQGGIVKVENPAVVVEVVVEAQVGSKLRSRDKKVPRSRTGPRIMLRSIHHFRYD
jgi:hypothetical protein